MSAAAWAGSPVEGGKVYTGDNGLEVDIVTVAPASKHQVVVLIKNSDSEMDDKAMLYDVQGAGTDSVNYKTTWHGRGWTAVASRKRWGATEFTLTVPGHRDDFHIAFNEAKTTALKPEEIYALYDKQGHDGTLKTITAFDRAAEQGRQEKAAAEMTEAFNQACGTHLTLNMDWKALSDENIRTYHYASFCGAPLEALRRMCSSNDAKQAVQAQVKKFSCKIGSDLKLEMSKSGDVVWTTSYDKPNQEDFAKTYFEKTL